jgi:predicted Zn-dependent protease
MRRFHEAGATARRALKVVPRSCQIHYILAVSLLMENGDSDEALDNLQRSVAEVPKAHLVAADLLSQRGRRQEAIVHLQEYLRDASPSDAERAKVEAMLAQLQQ